MKYAIVAIAKNEEKYLYDWVRYHHDLGFDGFFICDNNDEDSNTQFDEIARISHMYNIQVFDYRGRDALAKAGYQTGIYYTMYEHIRETHPECEWAAFIDIDEYFDFDGHRVDEFLVQSKFNKADIIHVNWKCYGDNNLTHYDPRPVIERFTTPAPIDCIYNIDGIPNGVYVNNHVKSIVRLQDKDCLPCNNHSFYFTDGTRCVDVEGKLVDEKSPFQAICYNGGHLKHFITKSTEEFIERKILCGTKVDDAKNFDINNILYGYFNMNARTYTKICMINDALAKVKPVEESQEEEKKETVETPVEEVTDSEDVGQRDSKSLS
jgi:hypothetical protein